MMTMFIFFLQNAKNVLMSGVNIRVVREAGNRGLILTRSGYLLITGGPDV